jgi:hypothetical protein
MNSKVKELDRLLRDAFECLTREEAKLVAGFAVIAAIGLHEDSEDELKSLFENLHDSLLMTQNS